MPSRLLFPYCRAVVLSGLIVALVLGATFLLTRSVSGLDSQSKVIARGGGTTVLEGGGTYVGPTQFTLTFHAEEQSDGTVTGALDCSGGPPQLYISGSIKSASVTDSVATLSGTGTFVETGITPDLEPVSFQIVARKGGPGAAIVLTINAPQQTVVFNWTMVQGAIDIPTRDK